MDKPTSLNPPSRATPYAVLVLGFALTAATGLGFYRVTTERDASSFRNAVESIEDAITERLDTYVAMLLGARALFASHGGRVTRDTFRTYARGLELQRRYPGAQGIGFARRFQADALDEVVADMRRAGTPDFHVWPAQSRRDERSAILFLEPLDRRNRVAIGYDMMADATRRAAMDRARDTGEPTASRGVTLVQEIDRHKQRGFLIYVPVYRDGHVPSSVAARREALIGFVYCPFRVDDLLAGVFGSQHEPRVTFEVFDSRPQPREETLLRTGGSRGRNDAWFSTTRRVPIAGRTWALRVRSTPSFERTSGGNALPYLLLLGVAISVVLFLVTRTQVRAREAALAARHRMAVLVDIAQRLAEAQLHLPLVLRTICEEVARRVTESCTINLVSASGTHLELVETSHLDPEAERSARALLASAPVPIGETSLGKVAANGQPILIPRVPHEALLASTRAEYRAHLERFPLASLVVVPLRVGTQIIGTVTVGRGAASPPFTLDDQQLVQDVADRAAIAIENARLAARLQQAVRVRDEFLSIAGHELRTPLAALLLQIDSVHRHAARGAFGAIPPRMLDRLASAHRHIQRLDRLVTELLDVSRIGAGKLAIQIEDVDLVALVSEIAERFSDQLARAGCELSIHSSEPVTGRWDRARLDQVFTNLVSNAIKYGASKPIEVRIERSGATVSVAVIDRGIGISAEDRERVFGRFERAVPDRNYGGLGLGLWISRQIVNALGGSIHLESQLGEGSTFIVELPISAQDERHESAVIGLLRDDSA